MTTTFAERCAVCEQCLPAAPYRDMLNRLHADMLGEIEALRAALQDANTFMDWDW